MSWPGNTQQVLVRAQNILAPATGLLFPPAGIAGLTTFEGTRNLFAGPPPPPVGTLRLINAGVGDSSVTFVTALPSTIANSQQAFTLFANFADNTLLAGLVARANLQNAAPVETTGYRFDYNFVVGVQALLRLIRWDAGVATVIASVDIFATPGLGYYRTNGATPGPTYHMTVNGAGVNTRIEGWMSAPGQPDTPHVVATGVSVQNYPTGRIGMLYFSNSGGVPLAGSFSGYSWVI